MWNTEPQLTSFITTWHRLLFSPLPHRCAHSRRWPEVGALAQGPESTLWQCPRPRGRWEGCCFHSGLCVCFLLSVKCVELHEFWKDSTLSFQPLPDGVTHRYILPGAPWDVSAQRAAALDSIPFTHPAHVAALLELLRHQCAINILLRTCVASQHAKPETMECNQVLSLKHCICPIAILSTLPTLGSKILLHLLIELTYKFVFFKSSAIHLGIHIFENVAKKVRFLFSLQRFSFENFF